MGVPAFAGFCGKGGALLIPGVRRVSWRFVFALSHVIM